MFYIVNKCFFLRFQLLIFDGVHPYNNEELQTPPSTPSFFASRLWEAEAPRQGLLRGCFSFPLQIHETQEVYL